MATTDIGGLFVKLGLAVDKNSFETGNKVIDTMTAKTSKLIGTVRNAGAAMVAMAAVTGTVENASIKTAAKLGLATEQLNMWKASAQIAGSSADGLVASMSKLNSAIVNRTIDGKGIAEIAKYYEMLGGTDFDQLLKMNSSDAFAEFMRVAMLQKDIKVTAELLERALGTGASEFYLMLQKSGMTLDEMLEEANKTQFTTSEDAANGKGFRDELTKLKLESESIGKLFGDEIGKELTPLIRDLNEWIQTHGDEIKTAVSETAKFIKVVAEKTIEITEWLIKKIGAGKQKAEINSTLANMIAEKGGKLIPGLGVYARKDKLNYEDLPVDLQEDIEQQGGKSKFSAYINDGIIRPGGQVTQVAPDDWVFAARNIGDMAAAFMPKNYETNNNMNAPSSYIINQTFNVSGSGNIAQAIRQQAYNGTRDGLMQAAAQSSKRLQMMSGVR